jgi:hypothetical protein
MKYLAAVFIASLVAFSNVDGQFKIGDAGLEKDFAKNFQLDFVVPESPAFNLIDLGTSDILRPTSARELAVAVSDFTGSGDGFTIPQKFAVEFSPGLLIGGNELSLDGYQEKPWLYRLRVSGATKRDEGGTGNAEMALGLRWTLIDESDLRTNTNFLGDITEITDTLNAIYVAAVKRRGPPMPGKKLTLTDGEIKTVKELNTQLKEKYGKIADEKWNARIFEIAIGTRFMAADAMGNDLVAEDLAFWSIYGHAFGSWGQLLLGPTFKLREELDESTFSLPARFYVGSNTYKAFAEA